MGRILCIVAVLRAPHVDLAPLLFSWLIGMSHRIEPCYRHKGQDFHGVFHLAEWGACASLFSLLLERSQHRMASYSFLALVFHHLLSF